MSYAILKFKIPEEKEDFMEALAARELNRSLRDLDQEMRQFSKYDSREGFETYCNIEGMDMLSQDSLTHYWRHRLCVLMTEAVIR